MSTRLERRLKDGFSGYTRSEKAVASFFLANMTRVPFETATTIAEATGVSPMTVGRFLRVLGYAGLAEVKRELRADSEASPVLISDRVERMTRGEGGERLRASFDAEVAALLDVYELVGSDAWERIVSRLATASRIRVAGFQTVEGLASMFAQRLAYLRPGVRLVDGKDGTFAEVFEDEDAFLFLIEMRRPTRAARLLAAAASEDGHPVAILCDGHCGWVHDVTSDVLAVSTDINLFWDNQTPMASALGLLLDAAAHRLDHSIPQRLDRLASLQNRFKTFE